MFQTFTLQKIFSDHALFQADASLVLNGTGESRAEIAARITRNGETVAQSSARSDKNGAFSLELKTPSASFAPCEITLQSRSDVFSIRDVLFGELWLASGQSNMELPNHAMANDQAILGEILDKKIRVYQLPTAPGNSDFPWEPFRMQDGAWLLPGENDRLAHVSAVALKFTTEIYDWLNRNAEVPVGFLNASRGGTPLPAWLPLDAIEKDERMAEKMKKIGNYPTPEAWNTRGDCNFQQSCCQYNVKIAPLEGAKVRGVLWYQGENEAAGEYDQKIYADYLRFYRRIYAERFGADPERFPMLSSLIYPWTYGASGECCVGYLNRAFVETATAEPENFIAAPVCDLAPSWAYHLNNHPIHPTNKYPLGARMASLALDNVYDRGNAQRSPAFLTSFERVGNRLRLRFDSVGDGLFLKGSRPIGLYVAGEDDVYMPAECEIASNGKSMEIWCDAVADPKNAAYAVQSLEPGCNLWSGMYPVYPFFTDREKRISIEARPWYDVSRASVWASRLRGDVLDLFFHPVWRPESGSEVCPDVAFTQEGQSLRVCAEAEDDAEFGCYVKSYPYNRLDLARFGKISVNLYNIENLSARFVAQWDGGEAEIPFEKTAKLGDGWARFEASLNDVPEDVSISSMHFRFSVANSPYNFVNLEKVRLWKKA